MKKKNSVNTDKTTKIQDFSEYNRNPTGSDPGSVVVYRLVWVVCPKFGHPVQSSDTPYKVRRITCQVKISIMLVFNCFSFRIVILLFLYHV